MPPGCFFILRQRSEKEKPSLAGRGVPRYKPMLRYGDTGHLGAGVNDSSNAQLVVLDDADLGFRSKRGNLARQPDRAR